MRPAGTPQFSLGKSFPCFTTLGPTLVTHLSAVLPLLPGDVILTGAPSGVGMGRTPPRYLTAGDEISTRVGDQTLQHTATAPAIDRSPDIEESTP